MYCSKCGSEIAEGNLFCAKCGTKVEGASFGENIQVKQDPKPVRRKKPLLIISVAVFAFIVLIIGGCVVWNKTFDIRYQKKIEIYISKENYEKAEDCYQKALEKYPENENVYLHGADVYLAQDKPRKALKVLLKGITETDSELLKEKISDVYQEQIATYIRRGKYEDAEELYKEMVDLDPENENVYLYGADVYVAQDNPQKAIKVLMKGIKETASEQLKEKKTTIYQEQIATYIREENYEGAESFYTEVVGMDSADENVYLYGADIYVAQDNPKEAILVLMKGIEETASEQLKEKKTTIYQEQIAAYIREENYEGAEIFYTEVADMDPADENVYLYGADIYLAQGRYTEGVEVLEEGITKTNGQGLAERKTYVDEHKILSEKTTYGSNGSIWLCEEYDEVGNKIKETTYKSNGTLNYLHEYDASGNLTKAIYYDSDGSIKAEYEYEYDASGNRTKETGYGWGEGIETYEYEYEYDASGNRIKTFLYASDGTLRWSGEYDASGNQTKSAYYDEDGSIGGWEENKYDASGNQTKHISYNDDGSIWDWDEYEYDASGNQTKEINYYSDGRIAFQTEYEYDAFGNQTKEIQYDGDGSIRLWFEYEYDASGNQTKWMYYNEDGSMESSEEYTYENEYDAAGNLTKEKKYASNGYIIFWNEYEYDALGNLTKEVTHDSDGNIDSLCTYSYTYAYTGTLLCDE